MLQQGRTFALLTNGRCIALLFQSPTCLVLAY